MCVYVRVAATVAKAVAERAQNQTILWSVFYEDKEMEGPLQITTAHVSATCSWMYLDFGLSFQVVSRCHLNYSMIYPYTIL